MKGIKEEYEKIRTLHVKKQSQKEFVSIEKARENKFIINWESFESLVPLKMGVHQLTNINSKEIVNYIDWTPFSHVGITWNVS